MRTRAPSSLARLASAIGAKEITLQHDSDVGAELGVEVFLEQVEGLLRVCARLHVESHEVVVLPGTLEDFTRDSDAELIGDIHAHRGELERDVRIELFLRDQVEQLEVLALRGVGFLLVRRALAEQVERGGDALCVQAAHRAMAVVTDSPATNRAAKDFATPLSRTKLKMPCRLDRNSSALRSISTLGDRERHDHDNGTPDAGNIAPPRPGLSDQREPSRVDTRMTG